MTSDALLTPARTQVDAPSAEIANRPRLWLPVAMVGLFWIFHFVAAQVELPTFVRFLSTMAVSLALSLAFLSWWLFNRRVPRSERLLAFAAALLGGLLVAPFCLETLGIWMLIFAVPPYLFTIGTLWLVIARRASARTRRLGLPVVLLLIWSACLPIRMNGISGEQKAEFHWRWTPTAGELYLAERTRRQAEQGEHRDDVSPSRPLDVEPGDWPGFRGPNRDGVVRGFIIDPDWKTHPPKRLWRQRVGPGWSSLAVVGDRLFTQEQRGSVEAVVCLDAATGREIWSHEDAVRFWESVGGEGPRATPTFAEGRIYALGATGILNCLDAASGERKWFRDIAADSGAKPPQWGFCSSPLVLNGIVVVFADGDKGLLAYRADTGAPAWTATAGQNSYSSPQRAVLAGQEQILFWSDRGLLALDPASGKVLWQHDAAAPGAPRSLQPHVAGPEQVLISSEGDLGTVFLDIKRDNDDWTIARRWTSKRLQPSFNDYVLHHGSIYGFDGAFFCCVDLQTGARRWKEGRYGHGQVVLLEDSSLLLIAAENGQVILLEANPDEPTELGRFQAIEGKTWNHPIVSHGRLYLRNGEEIACYELEVATNKPPRRQGRQEQKEKKS
jgi:outer membrane protein assembly factor BamB